MCEKSYQNKLFSILGDSISTFEGVSVPKNAVYYDRAQKMESGVVRQNDTWWGNAIERLGGELLVNNSFSGSTVSKLFGCEVDTYGCSDERTNALAKEDKTPDVILVFLGINDWGMGIPVYAMNGENTDCVFSVAYASMLNKLKANYPNAEIWCATLPRLDEHALRDGRDMRAYNEAIRAVAFREGCKVMEFASYDMTPDTMDDVHPTRAGMEALANLVCVALLDENKAL